MCKGTLPNRYLSKYKSDELLAQHERSTIEEKKCKKKLTGDSGSPTGPPQSGAKLDAK